VQLSFEQFCGQYSTEEACIDTMFKIKWPHGFRCPRCKNPYATTISTRRLPLYECRACHYQASLICGTVMEGSRTTLMKWFQAIYLMSNPSSSLNAVKLAAIIKVTYKTAWLMMHKLRHAISQFDNKQLLQQIVRINGLQYGRPYNSTIYRHPQEHPVLGGASVDSQGQITYMKLKKVNASFLSEGHILSSGIRNFTERHVSSKTTDVVSSTSRRPNQRFSPLLNKAKMAFRWINNTFHGIGSKHLQPYLDEFCFRENHSLRQVNSYGKLLHLTVTSETITYQELTQSLLHTDTQVPAKITTSMMIKKLQEYYLSLAPQSPLPGML